MSYYYRREDNGRLVKVEYSEVIRQDAMGFVVVDGVRARRVHSMDPKQKKKPKPKGRFRPKQILSDTLGVVSGQLQEMEADRKLNGFSGVEFVPDKTVKGFFQAKIDSDKDRWKYAKHRNMVDGNRRNGSSFKLTEEDFEKAKELVMRGESSVNR